jgi:hypothetical protein
MVDKQSWAYCAEERKSASVFLLRRNANLGFQKRNSTLCALNFYTQLLMTTFMTRFGMVVFLYTGYDSLIVKSSAC